MGKPKKDKPKRIYSNEMRKTLKTGDIVLFSGKGGISAGVKWVTHGDWSHVGMILRLPEYDFVTVWESTTLSSLVDLDTQVPRKGVQLVPLSARIKDYDGEIAVRQLDGVTFENDDIQELIKLRHEVAGRPYEQDMIELIKAAYDGPLGRNTEDLTSLFCSELVAEAYQRLGLLSNDKESNEYKPSNEYTPYDFSEDNKELKLLKGSLGEEIIMKSEA